MVVGGGLHPPVRDFGPVGTRVHKRDGDRTASHGAAQENADGLIETQSMPVAYVQMPVVLLMVPIVLVPVVALQPITVKNARFLRF